MFAAALMKMLTQGLSWLQFPNSHAKVPWLFRIWIKQLPRTAHKLFQLIVRRASCCHDGSTTLDGQHIRKLLPLADWLARSWNAVSLCFCCVHQLHSVAICTSLWIAQRAQFPKRRRHRRRLSRWNKICFSLPAWQGWCRRLMPFLWLNEMQAQSAPLQAWQSFFTPWTPVCGWKWSIFEQRIDWNL